MQDYRFYEINNVKMPSTEKISFILFSLILLSFGPKISRSQGLADSAKVLFWMTGGLGASSVGAPSGSAVVSISVTQMILSLRVTANSECAELFCGGDEFFDSAFLIGY